MLLDIMSVLVGLILLILSADKFVEGSSAVAKILGVSPLIIGMVIVGFGTSMPEMVVSTFAAIDQSSGIALGNAYGSNILNLGLILALTLLIRPIKVTQSIVRTELPLLLTATTVTLILLYDLKLRRTDALIMLFVFILIFGVMIYLSLQERTQVNLLKDSCLTTETNSQFSLKLAFFYLIAGLVLLILSSKLLVWGAVGIATYFEINDVIIGLTIVAIGTSLPELATSITAARKGENELVLGNIIGSNLMNTLLVVGIAGLIHPFSFAKEIFSRDIFVMTILTVLLVIFSYFAMKKDGVLSKLLGSILLCLYLGYTFWLILSI
ncbi:calcium/sodium antiporter [Thorsellia anophelis]|uniref:Cation:H+ antiporter n=1 Tax=Thorsellia anophelis DSM 18579 TaxID=1123402 RepID=A0A1H9YWQ7_9GAMM|nr:calcium/sodium antiporter [Thorsellia anophelis]SES73007.1 cation:H+ antiporter [Thorsellia anophelis DSM 18579]